MALPALTVYALHIDKRYQYRLKQRKLRPLWPPYFTLRFYVDYVFCRHTPVTDPLRPSIYLVRLIGIPLKLCNVDQSQSLQANFLAVFSTAQSHVICSFTYQPAPLASPSSCFALTVQHCSKWNHYVGSLHTTSNVVWRQAMDTTSSLPLSCVGTQF